MTIKETKNYSLQVGPSIEGNNNNCYKIINSDYNVVEIETYLLPQALKYLVELQASLDKEYDTSAKIFEFPAKKV